MDYRFVKPENWKYIIDVLKIKRVFCFCHSKDFKIDADIIINNIPIAYQQNMEDEKFSNSITYYITNLIKNAIPHSNQPSDNVNEKYPFCKDSKFYAPRWNVKNTSDPNILVLGIVNWKSFDQSIFIKEISDDRDMALNLTQYAFNILKKQLNTDVYRQRICAYLIDSISSQEFLFSRYSWKKPKHKLVPFINRLLNSSYPQIFPLLEIDGKNKIPSIYEKDMLRNSRTELKKYLRIEQELENMERQAQLDEDRAREDAEEERRMIDDFWNELGENSWNID